MTKNQYLFMRKITDTLGSFSMSPDVIEFIASQFALESNYGNSRLAKVHHNLCGMRTPSVRLSTVSPTSSPNFMSYMDDLHCVIDYLLWLSSNKFTRYHLFNLDSFKVKLVQCGYCPDEDYISKINSIYQQFKSYKDGRN